MILNPVVKEGEIFFVDEVNNLYIKCVRNCFAGEIISSDDFVDQDGNRPNPGDRIPDSLAERIWA